MRCASLLILAIVVGLLVRVRAEEWDVRKQQGRDYVTFDNVARFYRFADYSHANRTIAMRSEHRVIRAQVGTSEILINGVRFFTDFPLLERGDTQLISAEDVGKIIESVLRPSRIANGQKVTTVVLDPGHGGTDQGTANQWGSEKNFALDVALAARQELLHAGYKVEMTRSDDSGISLEDRVEFANRFPQAVFISIHFNSGSGGAGIESYALAPAGVPSNAGADGEHHLSGADSAADEGNAQDSQNIALAAAVHASVLSRAGAFDRGIRHARFKVLRHVRIPALLLEAGFLNNPIDAAHIATFQYRRQLGEAIAQGVQAYDAAVNYRAQNPPTFASVRPTLPPHTHSIVEPLSSSPPTAGNVMPETVSAGTHESEH
ncbi:MAG: N-acetylmuramoyl-L-alanine amidase [Verrucomicrobiota bacterium]|nr:N-acetylmuramoyl-L-alanine amidase [Verrucomicrobiota bacterium]